MKAIIHYLLFFPFICFAQNNQQTQIEKPPADACPTWSKKNSKTSKAEYFQFLKSNKAKDNRNVAYTVNPERSSYSITRTTAVAPRTERARKRNSSSTANEKEGNNIKTSSTKLFVEQKKKELDKETKEEEDKLVLTKEKVAVEEKDIEKKADVVQEKKVETPKASKDKSTINTEKIKKDTKVASRKVKRFFSPKNKGGKGKAAKCPDF